MKTWQFAALAAVFSFEARAQEARLYNPYDTTLAHRANVLQVEPYVAPFSERLGPSEKGNLSIDPHGSWRNRLILGAQSSSGSGAGRMDSKAGVVLNARQQLQLGIKANLF